MLTQSLLRQDFISLDISASPLYATVAHGTADYLLKFDAKIDNCWGPIQSGQDSILYIEIDVLTGETLFGIAENEPVVAFDEPQNALPNRMWFDATRCVMRVRSPDGTRWVDKPRVVVGRVINGNMNQITVRSFGSSAVGLNVASTPGYIIFDSALRPIRTSAGEFLTSETSVRMKSSSNYSAALVDPLSNYILGRATEALPPMSLVFLSGPDQLSLASSTPELANSKAPLGLVQHEAGPNDLVVMAMSGEISWSQWTWPSDAFGKPLYCGVHGELTTERPKSIQVFRVGYVKNVDTILLSIDSETETQVVSEANAIIEATLPLSIVETKNQLGENITRINLAQASDSSDGYISSQLYSQIQSATLQADAAFQIAQRADEAKADIGHIHQSTDIDGLHQAVVSAIASSNEILHPIQDAVADNFVMFANDGLIKDAGISINDFAAVNHVHTIADIELLQDALDQSAAKSHVHSYLDVIGLAGALEDRAYVQHTHPMISISGLVPALENKAEIGHVHVLADISDADATIATKIGFNNEVQYEPTTEYHPATKKYVDAQVESILAASELITSSSSSILAAVDSKLSIDNVAEFTPTSNYNPVSKIYLETYLSDVIAPIQIGIADLQSASQNLNSNLDFKIGFNNEMQYEPTTEYHPATKKYVDDAISAVQVPAPPASTPVTGLVPIPYNIKKDPALTFGGAIHHNTYNIFSSATDIVVNIMSESEWPGSENYTSSTLTELNSGPMPIGGWVVVSKHGDGNISFTGSNGVTISCAQAMLLDVLYTKMTLVKTGIDEWDLIPNNF